MSVDTNKIYEIKLNTTGSDVEPADILRLQLSGSDDIEFLDTDITSSVSAWQAGEEISGSTLIAEYETAATESNLTVLAARLKNENGACINEVSNPILFSGALPAEVLLTTTWTLEVRFSYLIGTSQTENNFEIQSFLLNDNSISEFEQSGSISGGAFPDQTADLAGKNILWFGNNNSLFMSYTSPAGSNQEISQIQIAIDGTTVKTIDPGPGFSDEALSTNLPGSSLNPAANVTLRITYVIGPT